MDIFEQPAQNHFFSNLSGYGDRNYSERRAERISRGIGKSERQAAIHLSKVMIGETHKGIVNICFTMLFSVSLFISPAQPFSEQISSRKTNSLARR